jgi:2-(1,2-epoxy-1,2-dihydrophenyl)acetyl-CoA isomerase
MTDAPSSETLQRHFADGVLTITLNRPDKLNALQWDMVERLTEWVTQAGADPAVRVIVITGAGRAFCSGDDIVGGMDGTGVVDIAAIRARIMDASSRGPHYELVRALLRTPRPIVAALNGRCHGAGFVTALACDFRVAHDDVLIGDIRAAKAIFSNQGAGLLLPKLIGHARAIDLLVTGRVITAAEAERIGLIQRVWPSANWRTDLDQFVRELADGPTKTYAAWKLSVNRSILQELPDYTDDERTLDIDVFHSHDIAEGVRAFAERRPPRFTGT